MATANHKVVIRIKTVKAMAAGISIPRTINSDIIAPSAPPRPPGKNDKAPINTDREYTKIAKVKLE